MTRTPIQHPHASNPNPFIETTDAVLEVTNDAR